MNDRMLELAVQAGLKKPHSSDHEYIGDFDWRKFGELLIQECSDIADNYDGVGSIIVSRIKKHFGVNND
jgi:hypothetical protein